jgi:hypothetical protein
LWNYDEYGRLDLSKGGAGNIHLVKGLCERELEKIDLYLKISKYQTRGQNDFFALVQDWRKIFFKF